MRTCSKCRISKDPTAFGKSSYSKDGLYSICKECKYIKNRVKQLLCSNEIKEYLQNYNEENREEVKEKKRKHYRKNREYYISLRKQYKEDHPEVIAAHRAVRYAVQTEKLIRPDVCEICEEKGDIQAHHISYEVEHQLKVIWMCSSCHVSLHKEEGL